MTNPNTNQAWAIEPFTLARIQAYVLRWPVKRPVQTSFGTMHDRPALLVR